MIYEIANLRVKIENQYPYTTEFCKEYLSKDQNAPVDIVAKITQQDFDREKEQSIGYSDGYIENICLYRNLCLQLPSLHRLLLHASVLEHDGEGYAFLGQSGSGKSTHTKLWGQYLSNCRVINGDKPIIEERSEGFVAYGTPWRGKENWGEKRSVLLKGFCFIEQAKENSIKRLTPSEFSMLLFRQVLMPSQEREVIATLDMLDRIVNKIPAYVLQCDISEDAVKTSYTVLTGKDYSKNKR